MLTRALLISLFCCAALAAGTVVEFHPARTNVEWVLDATLHKVQGTFKLKSGVIRFDPATGKANGEIVIDAASGESGNSSRDSKMHKSVLESAKYPEITFSPDRITEKAAHGTVTIRGVAHELTIPVKTVIGAGEARIDASFTVPYAAWGMKNPGTLFLRVRDEVAITVRAIATMKPQ